MRKNIILYAIILTAVYGLILIIAVGPKYFAYKSPSSRAHHSMKWLQENELHIIIDEYDSTASLILLRHDEKVRVRYTIRNFELDHRDEYIQLYDGIETPLTMTRTVTY